MMQLGEFPTEQELKTMVAEVDQVMMQLVTHPDDLCYSYLDFCDDHYREIYCTSDNGKFTIMRKIGTQTGTSIIC